MILIVLAVAAGGYASAKSYQFTGVVKAVDSNSLMVEKSAKETWQFELTKDTKGVNTEDRRSCHDLLQDDGDRGRNEPDEVRGRVSGPGFATFS